ncbi:hypothetical protein FACS189419_09080 [Planctomycetales bacterium]|nr:hypothetical protein FACS189419_09080 [Planctomycetales bacterium]
MIRLGSGTVKLRFLFLLDVKHLICLLPALFLLGCAQSAVVNQIEDIGEPPKVSTTKKDDSTACAYWKCSTTKKLYMQKYVKDTNGNYHPAGSYKLDEGEGAFPLKDLDKYGSDGNAVSVEAGADACPYDRNPNLVKRGCGKTYCEKAGATSGTCPWCGNHGSYRSGSWSTGGGG